MLSWAKALVARAKLRTRTAVTTNRRFIFSSPYALIGFPEISLLHRVVQIPHVCGLRHLLGILDLIDRGWLYPPGALALALSGML